MSTSPASLGFTTAYLASIYLLPSSRVSHLAPSPPQPPASDVASSIPAAPSRRDRNHPSVIKARLLAVSLASTASAAALPFLASPAPVTTWAGYRAALPASLKLLGLSLPSSSPAQLTRLLLLPGLGLTASLFAGSLYIKYLAGELPWQREWRGTKGGWRSVLAAKFDGLKGLRNLIIAPLTEELTFRSCVIAVSFLGGWSKSQIVFLTPLWFGLAHVHHAWETYLAGGRTKQALLQGVFSSIFQFAYTTLFGWYAAFLFIRTGSILPPFFAHALCNSLGLPPLAWALQVWPQKKISLFAAYFAGIGTFIYGFWRWTEPSLFGGSVFWP